MEKSADATNVRRHLSQLKILSRLFEHELELAKGDEVVLDKHLVENTLDTLEIFVEDMDTARGVQTARAERKVAAEGKPQVTRLN